MTMKRILALAAAVALTGAVAAPAAADGHLTNHIVYSGQGWADGEPEEVTCDDETTGYLLWVLAGSSASEVVVHVDGSPVGYMDKKGNGNGAFKLVTDYFDPTDAHIVVHYDGAARNAQFVISHGCPGEPYDPYDPYDPS